jgi:hypothetical protein
MFSHQHSNENDRFKNGQQNAQPSSSSANDREGKVWVKDGKLFCKSSPSHRPTVTVGQGVQLFKNNQLVTGTVEVTEADEFEIKVEEEIIETKWKITIDESKLNVMLHIEPGMRKTYKVNDIAPAPHIELNAEEQIEVQHGLQYNQLLQELQSLNVTHGLRYSEIVRAVNAKEPGQFIIASGDPPREGRDGWVELKVDIDDQQKGPKLREDGTVDFRELRNIPTVHKGQVIAAVHPPVPGVWGVTVTNEPIPAKKTHPVVVQPGKGVSMIENEIVATEIGRPCIEQKGLLVKISVISKFIHQGDVDISTGNIRFKGDVEITGSVEDGMSVEADGNITVFNNVNRANLSSKQAIFIRHNVIGSTISAGENRIVVEELEHLLHSLEEHFQRFVLSIQQIVTSPTSPFQAADFKQKALFSLIKLLLDQKFRTLLTMVKQYMDICKTNQSSLESEWTTLADELRRCFFSPVPNECHSLEYLTKLLANIKEVVDKNQVENNQNCYIELSYALNSTIYCSGDITILGQGCYNSKIHAGGLLKVNGVVRGGEVYARHGAIIKEAGSQAGISTLIIVPHDQVIKIEHVWEGTTIQIGKVKHHFQKEQRFINAVLNEQGQITFGS